MSIVVYCRVLSRLPICMLALAVATAMMSQSSDPNKVYSLEKGIKPPRATYHPEPNWSKQSRKYDLEGSVVIGGYVGTDGRFHDARVIRSLRPSIDADALEGVKKWKFHPCTKDGQPVNCALTMEVGFKIVK